MHCIVQLRHRKCLQAVCILCLAGAVQNLSNVAYACGRLNHLDPSLLATISRRALAQMQVIHAFAAC